MASRKRLKNHKRRAMRRRLISGKKPMSKEQKEVQKKAREAQSAAQKKINEKAKAAKAK